MENLNRTHAAAPRDESRPRGLSFSRHFTKEGHDPLADLKFIKRRSVITEPNGKVVFEMDAVEVPETWSQLATDVLASKYFRKAGLPGIGRESSLKQVVHRIVHSIRAYGEDHGYFRTALDADTFADELTYLLTTQRGAFNSPVWFNLGLWQEYGIKGSGGNWYWNDGSAAIAMIENNYERPQCSACFIQRVEDDLMSIFSLVQKEAKVFKYGSGTGTNFSRLRSRFEKLSGGGTSSGVMSFLEVFDKGAGATKSGGTTRRAAKMVILDVDHPEIVDFIQWKAKEEKKAKILIAAGYDADFNGEAYHTIAGQNSNNSVRVNEQFMQAYEQDRDWQTILRSTGEVHETHKARGLMRQLAEAAWACADPGMQYDTTINDWHTCSNTERIWASNPCSEFMFLDDTACNLASLNLMKFRDAQGRIDIPAYKSAIRTFATAMEILVDFSSYPTQEIAQNSHDYRPLGLGYANLGTLLMVNGMPYDSEEGRALGAALTSILCGEAYAVSAELAETKGAFPGYAKNREPMLRVMRKHRDAAARIDSRVCPTPLWQAAQEAWERAERLGVEHGYRNSQMTVLAPTGTIGLLMDCDTTGVEPDFSLVKWKKLAGGGYMKIVNQSLKDALRHLGYHQTQIDDVLLHILGTGSLEAAEPLDLAKFSALGFTDDEIQEAAQSVRMTGALSDFTPHINPKTLRAKGVPEADLRAAMVRVGGAETIEGAPHLKLEHLPVFDCANKCGELGQRYIAPLAHIKMMAAVQPFISGAISKTINVPEHTTVEEIEDLYVQGWRYGLKAVALYRDNSKGSQPLSTKLASEKAKDEPVAEAAVATASAVAVLPADQRLWGERRVLPRRRNGFTLEATVAGHKLFMRTGEYENGELGEIFIDMYKEGAAYRSMMNSFAQAVSVGLSYGVPLEKYVKMYTFTRFEPYGITDHPNVRTCTSILDFIFRILGMEYLGQHDFIHVPPTLIDTRSDGNPLVNGHTNGSVAPALPDSGQGAPKAPLSGEKQAPAEKKVSAQAAAHAAAAHAESHSHHPDWKEPHDMLDEQMAEMMGDAPVCDSCGHLTVRNGSCYRCLSCGNSMGCS